MGTSIAIRTFILYCFILSPLTLTLPITENFLHFYSFKKYFKEFYKLIFLMGTKEMYYLLPSLWAHFVPMM